MERLGITYPALDIGDILRSSDLAHINNEIPFTPDCPFPELYPTSLTFCSDPSYISLLEEIGTDIVELSGDHFADYGPDAMLNTLQLYAQRDWQVYGGGENELRAREPILIEHNSNQIAMLGCNIGCKIKTEISCKALAQGDRPGAATCDFEWLDNEIKQLSDQGYTVVFTFQHKEYFTYTPQPDLIRDFGRVARAGAAIVSGSQAHQPHAMAFQDDAFIHYGLGNLFFDQYNYCADYACNNGFIDRHVFYDNHYISTELITIRFVDMARPRLMTPEERTNFLKLIFQTGGW
jgi:poly-gamma-glutamate synthesis protein (capsule biosynthesis protein)